MYRQKNFKLNIIYAAAKLFELSDTEREILANKAGLTLNKNNNDFNEYINSLIFFSHKKHKLIYDKALISDRMYRHIRSDYHPTKGSLLGLAISLDLQTDEIYLLLQKAGYVLSESIAFDMVIKHLLENPQTAKSVFYINDILYELNLPLLMTREKS